MKKYNGLTTILDLANDNLVSKNIANFLIRAGVFTIEDLLEQIKIGVPIPRIGPASIMQLHEALQEAGFKLLNEDEYNKLKLSLSDKSPSVLFKYNQYLVSAIKKLERKQLNIDQINALPNKNVMLGGLGLLPEEIKSLLDALEDHEKK